MPITLDVNTLVQMAAKAPEDSSIIVKNGGFESVGKVGAFFASKAQCRLASQALLEGVRQQYGDGVADAIAPDLRALITKGKPLSARTVNDLVGKADDMAKWMKPHNVMLAQKFNAGSGVSGVKPGTETPIPGNTVNLDTVFSEACAKHGLNAADPELKSLLGKMVLDMAEKSKTMVSVTAMRDFVLNNAVKAHNTLLASRFVSSGQKDTAMSFQPQWNGLNPAQKEDVSQSVDSAVQKMIRQADTALDGTNLYVLARNVATARIFDLSGQKDAVLDALIRSNHLDPNRKADLAKVTDMALSKWAMQTPDRYAMPPSLESLGDLVRNGKLPGLGNLFYALGLPGQQNASKQEVLDMAVNSPHLADFSMLIEECDPTFTPGVLYALQKLPAMRAIQPEGILTRDTIWQACFNGPLPEKLRSATSGELGSAMFDALTSRFQRETSSTADSTMRAPSLIGAGIKEDKVLQYLHGSVSIDLDDFVSPPALTALQKLPRTVDLAEVALANDIHREDRNVTFYTDDPSAPPAGLISFKDTSHLSAEEKAAYDTAKPSPVSHALVEQCRALCNGNDAQLRQVVLSLGQSGGLLMRAASFAATDPEKRNDFSYMQRQALSEHSAVDIDVRRQANGDVTMHFRRPPDTRVAMDYTFTVRPDGTSYLNSCNIAEVQTSFKPWKAKVNSGTVCEATTLTWLTQAKIRGIDAACNLTPNECSRLQAKMENGSDMGFTQLLWPDHLDYDSWTDSAVLLEGLKNAKDGAETALNSLRVGEYGYIAQSPKRPGRGFGHAMCLYHGNGEYVFVDPNRGIWRGSDREVIVRELEKSLSKRPPASMFKDRLDDVPLTEESLAALERSHPHPSLVAEEDRQ